jgi:hypothetical protein
MSLEEFDPPRLFRRFRRAVRRSSRLTTLSIVWSWWLRLPGMRPQAPKRNVIVGLVYVYVGSILTAVALV